ncbi:DNA-binding response regulator [Sphingobacterium sp. PCS056]|jgi:DNA-binding NarL/FixJ family response regulator|uniref:response regulator transcription factor n=1 Tax=Sphingobacterium TaxID=28453 RepID=UPI00200CC233|nr:DNA-binding response regulator [Sphingobacterium sp. PCS056]UPZ37809.1 DNA-binding response regulator [Sphingobacterium sp. PCS056]
MEIKILIIEDEMIIARFIEQHFYAFYQNIEINIALSVEEVDNYMREQQPDLVLCDIQLQDDCDGIDLMVKYKAEKQFSLIFITSYDSKHCIDRTIAVNAENYIIKPLNESRLYAGTHIAIQRIAQDKRNRKISPNLSELTSAEIQVLKLIANRYTTKHIADKLCLSPYTIKNTRHRICRKLSLEEENNALLTWAIEHQHMLEN